MVNVAKIYVEIGVNGVHGQHALQPVGMERSEKENEFVDVSMALLAAVVGRVKLKSVQRICPVLMSW